jgi:glycosyltransferase involved in cell wall biosynthesis
MQAELTNSGSTPRTSSVPLTVSVVIPTRNRAILLNRAVRSVLNQKDIDPMSFELIVVEQHSTDDTLTQLRSFGDARLQTIQISPTGPSEARNVGVSVARGTWIAFLDDDDYWAPTKLAEQLADLERSGADWGWTATYFVDESGRLVGQRAVDACRDGRAFEQLCEENVVTSTSTVMVKRELFLQSGGFRTDVSYGEDWLKWIDLGQQGKAAATPGFLTATRLGFGSATANPGRVRSTLALVDQIRGPAHSQIEKRTRKANLFSNLSTSYLRANRRFPSASYRLASAWHSRSPFGVAKAMAIVILGPKRSLRSRSHKDLNGPTVPGWIAQS